MSRAAMVLSVAPESPVPGSLFLVPDTREAPLVSAVARPFAAEATRDRAVARTGEGPVAAAPSRDSRSTPLALLLT
jgi:hypothetical protein